jgi:hypothetical protein
MVLSCGLDAPALSLQAGIAVIPHIHILHESVGRGKTLTPRQAVAISLGGLSVGAVVVVLACTLFLVPFWEAMIYYAIGGYFVLAFPWACLDRESQRRVIRAHNRLVYFFGALLVVTLVAQWATNGKPFPKWAVGALIVGAVVSYSVMGYYAVVNFRRWRHGDFREPSR